MVDPTGKETVLYHFTGGADGGEPGSGVIRDEAGNLYGMTHEGGADDFGVVYEVDPAGHETVLHSFTGKPDGRSPYGGLIRSSAGDLYGTTLGAAAWVTGRFSRWTPGVMRRCCTISDSAKGPFPVQA